MINYLSKFSPRLSQLFNWGPEHQTDFQQMKKEISCAPVLAYYNPKKQIMLQTIASIKGLSACLLQEEKPVYFASKALLLQEPRKDM